jgi:hypothetical protein
MVKTAPKSKRITQSNIKISRPLLIGVAIIGLLLIAWFVHYFSSVHSTDKVKLQKDVSALLDKAMLEDGTPVYTDVSDTGCDNGTSVGLLIRVGCGIDAYKLSKTTSSAYINLQQVDETLLSNGWSRGEVFGDALKDIRHLSPLSPDDQAIQYMRGGLALSVDVTALREGDNTLHDSTIRDLITKGKVAQPGADETIYGIRIGAGYWYCEGGAFLNPCFAPPSKPE